MNRTVIWPAGGHMRDFAWYSSILYCDRKGLLLQRDANGLFQLLLQNKGSNQ